MREEDFGVIIPYGLMIGAHVTPIDHQYFSPTDFQSARDAYPVYAMADATIVDIQPRNTDRGTEYRFVFTLSCTFFYYYDLVTELSPDIDAIYKAKSTRGIEIKVTAGQEIGRIGGQTLDFAVWDTTKPLKNFINPESYEGEPWKIFTNDPLNYYSVDLKAKALAKYARFAEPKSGVIDYDIDGKLIGNWFKEGTNGYAGSSGVTGNNNYWIGHLAIAPDHIDPTATVFSIGTWNSGDAAQFLVKNPIDPTTVGVNTGIVMYELYQGELKSPDGMRWIATKPVEGIKYTATNQVEGCVLLQLIETRKLKLETFPTRSCSEGLNFSTSAVFYNR